MNVEGGSKRKLEAGAEAVPETGQPMTTWQWEGMRKAGRPKRLTKRQKRRVPARTSLSPILREPFYGTSWGSPSQGTPDMTTIKHRGTPLTPTEARQAVRGNRILLVLVAALFLAGIGWVLVEMWGQHIDPNKSSGATPAPTAATGSGTEPPGTAAGGQPPQSTTIDKSENNQLSTKSTPEQPSREGTQN